MPELQRSLSFPAILLITLNSIMGTGIFFLPALAAATAGNLSIIAWAFMGLVAIAISFVFAELSSMYPKAGGVYEYCKQAYGSFPSFLVGWTTVVVSYVTIAMLVVGAIRYLNPGLPEPLKIAFSILFILLFNLMAYRGLQTSKFMLIAFSFITLTALLSLIIPGLTAMNTNNFHPFVTHEWGLLFLAVFVVAETFFGWETATFLAEETKDAEHVIPRALITGTIIIAIVALLFVVMSLGVLPWQVFGQEVAPLTRLGAELYGYQAAPFFSILVYISIIGSVAGWIVSSPRLLMSLSKDRMFIEQLGAIHPKHHTPHRAILFQTIITSILVVIGAGSYEVLLKILVPLVLVMYSSVIIALLVLRVKQPEVERPFRFRGAWFFAPLIVLIVLALLGYWSFNDKDALGLLKIAGTLLVAGLPVYALLKFTYDPDAVISNAKFTARLWVLLENVLLPKRIRREVLSLLTLTKKHVLEYGSNVGTFTLHLAEAVGPEGVVYATEVSEKNAAIVKKRMDARGHKHVRVIHDEHQVNRVHPDVHRVDIVVSIGFLSYVQDLRKVLREIKDCLPRNGVVLFVEYVDYFKILPNSGVISDIPLLRETFQKEGFSIKIEKRRGFLWNYLIIHGIRTDQAVPFI